MRAAIGVSVDQSTLNTRSMFKGTQFGIGLAKARIAAGLTQTAVADLLGRKQTIISSWENGRAEPDIATLVQLLNVYHVSFEDIIRHTPHPAEITTDEMCLVLRFRKLSRQNQEAIEAVMTVYEKYQ